MALGILLKAIRGIDLDTHNQYKSPEHAGYIKNLVMGHIESKGDAGEGNAGDGKMHTPTTSNFIYCGDLAVPSGINFCIGFYESEDTNEAYVFCWNSEANHFIYRINGNGSPCQMVYQGTCLNFQLEPRYFIPPFRVALKTTCITDPATNTTSTAKYLVFTDNKNKPRFIAVEDSIATNSFNIAEYPYFDSKESCCGPCSLINLNIPFPQGCIKVEPIYETPPSGKTNLLPNQMFKFRIKGTDHWGRPGEHSRVSKPFYINIGQCQTNAAGLPRCLKLTIPAGCPTIEKIQVEVQTCQINDAAVVVTSDWSLYDTFDVYANCNNTLPWYQRVKRNDNIKYDPETNTFEYIFCNNKECLAIPIAETNRLFNPVPHTAGSLWPLGKSIAMANLTEGEQPLPCETLKAITFEVRPPTGETSGICRPKTRKVRIEMVIHGMLANRNQPIWKSPERNDVNVWGGLGDEVGAFNTVEFENATAGEYSQYTLAGKTGFPGYFAGTGIVGYSKQYILSEDRQSYTENLADDGTSNTLRRNIVGSIRSNKIRVQVWEFENVPEGRQVFRIGWHLADTALPTFQGTSSFTVGRVSVGGYTGTSIPPLLNHLKEIVIPCTGEYNNKVNDNFFVVMSDNTRPKTDSQSRPRSAVIYGYVKDFNNNPIALAALTNRETPPPANYQGYTDHNGFYFGYDPDSGVTRWIWGKDKCSTTILAVPAKSGVGSEQEDVKLTEALTTCLSNRIRVTGEIKDCNGVGISNIPVVLTRGQIGRTDVNGRFTIITHDTLVPGDPFDRSNDQLLILQNGVCILSPCGQPCNVCIDPLQIHLPGCDPSCTIRTLTLNPPLFQLIEGVNNAGPKAGGLFNLGLTAEDCYNSTTFIQNIDEWNLSIPSWQESGIPDFSRIFFNIPPGTRFPTNFKSITFWRTANLAYPDYLQWVAEKVEYIDYAGNLAPDNPQKIKLYISGLVAYNDLFNFKTNVNYQFLQGDRIEFITKSNGDLFPPNISLLVTDSKDGDYIIVDYDERLAGLTGGIQIQMMRANSCVNKNFYYEIPCATIELDSEGIPKVLTGELQINDTYIFRRIIPYKVNDVMRSNVFPFAFEHHSPSDLWGSHCDDRGRVYVKNPYERRACYPTKTRLSNAFVLNNTLNGIGRFDEADSIVFDEQEWGSITGVFTQLNTMNVICANDNFIVTYSDDRLRVTSTGSVVANSSLFSRPERKIGSNYGCQADDINTLRQYKGRIYFIDSSKLGFIENNYGQSIDISIEAMFKGHLSEKVRHIQQWNRDNPTKKKFWHGSADCKLDMYLITSFILDQENLSYVNTLREENIEANETFAIDIVRRSFALAYSFTGEYMGSFFGQILANQLISFKNGLPWLHYDPVNPGQSYMNYFGVQCEPVYEPVYNMDRDRVKRFSATMVHCRQQLLFADRVLTESGQRSRILIAAWERQDNVWKADFKSDLNTFPDPNISVLQDPNKIIFEGDLLYGKWIRVRYVGIPENNGTHFEFDGVSIFEIAAEKKSGG